MADAGAAGLSLAVRLGELNDFLRPSVECAVDLEKPRLLSTTGPRPGAATVSASDCLACSGCVTTAEIVLSSLHNHQCLLDALRVGDAAVVISFSAVSEAALMASRHFAKRSTLYAWLRTRIPSAWLICSCDLAEQLATAHCDDAVVSNHCPGVVLYAEKFAQELIPQVSVAPTVQVWQGVCVKYLLRLSAARRRSLPMSTKVYHVMVNMCADKKLEVIRPEFKEFVDLALTTDELLIALDVLGTDELGAASQRDPRDTDWDLCHRLAHHFGGLAPLTTYDLERSNGVAVAKELELLRRETGEPLPSRRGFNVDHNEWQGGRLTCATGLRNMKNMMSAAKIRKIEKLDLLACPKGGCFSGPGHANIYRDDHASTDYEDMTLKEQSRRVFVQAVRFRVNRPELVIQLLSAALRRELRYELKPVAEQPLANNW